MDMYRKTPQLALTDATRILSEVFEENNMESSKIPLETFLAYSNYRRERFVTQRVVAGVMFVLFLLLPVLFVLPGISLESVDSGEPGRPAFVVRVKHGGFVRSITARINDVNMPVYQKDENTYSIEPTMNGEMTVRVTLSNRQYEEVTTDVEGVDTEPPVLESDFMDDDRVLRLTLSDEGSGIDFEKIYAVTADGQTIQPLSWNEATGEVCFACPSDDMNVYFPDKVGNIYHIVITLR